MIAYDSASFDAGQDCGTRVAACIARLAALELMESSRWWSRRRRRLMARALVAHAEALERAADGAVLAQPRGSPAVELVRESDRVGVSRDVRPFTPVTGA